MIRNAWLKLLPCLFVALSACADDVDVKLAGLLVHEDANRFQPRIPPWQSVYNTQVSLLVVPRGRRVVQFDLAKSRITKFVDDKGTDLYAPMKDGTRALDYSPKFSKDRSALLTGLISTSPVAEGATSLSIEGVLALALAKEPEVAKSDLFDLTAPGPVKVGEETFKLISTGGPRLSGDAILVSLESPLAAERIEKLRFLDGSGKEIQAQRVGCRTSSTGTVTTVIFEYDLKTRADKVAIEVTMYRGGEPTEVPLHLHIGFRWEGEDGKGAGWGMHPIGLQVERKLKGFEGQEGPWSPNNGLQAAFRLASPGARYLDLDMGGTKIACADDKGTKFGASLDGLCDTRPVLADEGKSSLLGLRWSGFLADDATTATLEGKISIRSMDGEDSSRSPVIDAKQGQESAAGALKLGIVDVRETPGAQWPVQMSIRIDVDPHLVSRIRAFDADGKEMESSLGQAAQFWNAASRRFDWRYPLSLKQAAPRLAIEVCCWKAAAPVAIPFHLKCTVELTRD